MLTLLLWLLSAVAMADSPVVDALWAVDADGVLVSVEETGEAFVVRGEAQEPLAVGDVLASGELVRTLNARVRLRMERDQQIVIGEDSALILESERDVVQQAGEVFYRVRGYFKVRYGTVEAAVEGTEFIVRIAPDGTVSVEVLQGTVRVSEERGEVIVERGHGAQVAPQQAPAAPTPLQKRGEATGTPLRASVGAPRASIAAMLGVASSEDGGGFLPDGGGTGSVLRLTGRYRLTPGWRATVDTAVVIGGGRFFLPQSVGVERRLMGGVSVGGSAVALVGGKACEPGTDVRLGGAASAGLRIPVGYFLSVEALGRVGSTVSLATGDAPELLYDLAVGVGVGF